MAAQVSVVIASYEYAATGVVAFTEAHLPEDGGKFEPLLAVMYVDGVVAVETMHESGGVDDGDIFLHV